MNSKIGKLIPKPLKNLLIRISYLPEKIFYFFYRNGATNKIHIPDKMFQRMDFWVFNKKWLSFKNPQGFNEKLQWMKYYYRNPEYTKLVDKYEVRKYVESKVGSDILVPCYGVFDKWEDIDFDKLPNEFVIKCTHDSGSVVICNDKSNFDFDAAKEKIEKWLNRNQFYLSREWPYKNVKPRIIIEKYLANSNGDDSVDYKFFCFNGTPKMIDILSDRHSSTGMHEDFYDMNWQAYDVQKDRFPRCNHKLEKPDCFDRIKEIAEILSQGFPHIRVDFFVVEGKPYFTELTFYMDCGRIPFNPESFNLWLGEQLTLPPKMR